MGIGEKLGAVAGTILGTVIGGPFGAAAGPAIGSAVGGAIEDAIDGAQASDPTPTPTQPPAGYYPPPAPAPKPMVSSKLCWLGFATAVVPSALNYGLSIDFTQYTNVYVDAAIIGVLTMGLRLFTNGAIGPRT